MIDNQSAIKIATNDQIHSKIKHLDIKYMALRGRVKNKQVHAQYVTTKDQVADIMTKPMAREQFVYLRNKMGLLPIITTIMKIILVLTTMLTITSVNCPRVSLQGKYFWLLILISNFIHSTDSSCRVDA